MLDQIKLLNNCAGVGFERRLVGVSVLGGLVSGLFLDGMVSSEVLFWDSGVVFVVGLGGCDRVLEGFAWNECGFGI